MFNIDYKVKNEFSKAKKEVGFKEFEKHFRLVFGRPMLDYAQTMVINLPGPCHANCIYCIDKYLIKNVINYDDFLIICEKAFKEFPNIKEISITGGSLNANYFNKLINIINNYYSNITITWNTNGILIDENYNIDTIKYINLHRNHIDDDKNKMIFQSNRPILSITNAKKLFGDKLYLRITVDESFNIDEYSSIGIPLYINKMLPGNKDTNEIFDNTLKKLNISNQIDIRRRNKYLNCYYNNVHVRVCLGDNLAKRVSGRYPVFLNVVIIHRNGKICGSWYEDDKLIL